MSNNLSDLLINLKVNQEIITHKEPDPNIGVLCNGSSCYIPSKNVLVKGEVNKQRKKKRNAVITLIEPNSKKIIGKY